MKLKHIFSYLVIVLISVFVCSVAVSAENEPTYFIDEKISDDRTVSVKLSFTPDVAAAGTIKLTYNTDSLELKSAVKGSADAQMINVNSKENRSISVNFLNAYGAVTGNTELAVIEFSLKADRFSAEDISFDSFKLYDIDSELLSDNTTTELIYSFDGDNSPTDIEIVSKPQSDLRQSVKDDVSNAESSMIVENIVSETSTDYQENIDIQSSAISEIKKSISYNSEKSDVSENVSTVSSEISEMSVFESSTVNQENSPTNTAVIFIVCAVVFIAAVVAVIITKNSRRQSK